MFEHRPTKVMPSSSSAGEKQGETWDYYLIGIGIVGALVRREDLWRVAEYAPYHTFYNVLARLEGGKLVQHETFHDDHDDWELRATAPYVLFDQASSTFNLVSPAHVASYNGRVPEVWKHDPRKGD